MDDDGDYCWGDHSDEEEDEEEREPTGYDENMAYPVGHEYTTYTTPQGGAKRWTVAGYIYYSDAQMFYIITDGDVTREVGRWEIRNA